MKTKTVKFHIDLYPGWQDIDMNLWANTKPSFAELPPGTRRVCISVDLPCFGGTADASKEVQGRVEE